MIYIFITLICSVICSVLGRMGGASGYNTKFRDLGIPTIVTIQTLVLSHTMLGNWWALVIMFGLMFAALTTYWDFLFGYDNFYAHGFVIGLATLPTSIASGHWLGGVICILLYTAWMGIWSKVVQNVVWEEAGRYTIIPIGIWSLIKL